MKNKLMVCITILFLGFVANSQDRNKNDFDKIKALKVAFFTDQLNLSSSEAETFWPMYNTYEKTRHQLGKQQKREFYNKLDDQSISEDGASMLLIKYLDVEEKEEELDKKFTLDMEKMIGAKKTLLLLKAEKDFHKKLIKEYRKKHGGK